MSAQHTPGPWFVDAEHAGLFEQDQARFWINASGTHVAYVDGPRNDERTANAHLIAAAPELLETAQRLLAWIEVLLHALDAEMDGFRLELSDSKTGASETIRLKEHFDNARAAIAKATGGTA